MSPRLAFGVLSAVFVCGALSCNAAIGGGVAAVTIGAGVLAYGCDDYVGVTVRDAVTGNQTCDAVVTARDSDGDDYELRPCFQSTSARALGR